MNRQYKVVYNGDVVGKFTIKCQKSELGGWTAYAHYRNNFTSWSLEKQTDFVNKDDAIESAYQTMVKQSLQDKFELVPVEKTQWAIA